MPLRPRLLSTWNLKPHYGIDNTLRAFALVKARCPEASLTIVGYGSEERRLRALAASLDAGDIEFVGRTAPADMAALYERCDIFVNSSLVDNQPVSVLEAFAGGLPVVSSGTGDISAMVRDGEKGLIVPPEDPTAMAKAVATLLETRIGLCGWSVGLCRRSNDPLGRGYRTNGARSTGSAKDEREGRMIILGINDGHNAAACLYEDGQVVAAIQEERLRRVKNWSGMPAEAIRTVLKMRGISAGEVDFVAMNGHHAAFPMTRDELAEEYRTINDFGVTVRRGIRRAIRRAVRSTPLYRLHQERGQQERVRDLTRMGLPPEKIVFVEHHTAHAAAAYYGLGNFEDDILVLTCDGAGDGRCATVNIGRGGRIERLHAVDQGHSVGNIYAMVTFLMGMVPLEHEYKLMGLAPYADSRGAERVFQDLMRLIRFDLKNPLVWERTGGCPETYLSYRFLKELLEHKRFDWIAGGLQKFTEAILTRWVSNCLKETGVRRLALGGGIFMNVKVNKLIMELPEVQDVFVYPSCGDETNAMGATYWVYADRAGIAKMGPLQDLYWGPQSSDDEVEEVLRGYRFNAPVRYEKVTPIEPMVARLLANGKVVARFKGREEFGARALGNRSILANPSDPTVVRVINEAIKSRDFWMPFAPSLLEESSLEYLVNPKGIRAPYMILSFETTERRNDIRAAIHPFDFTARPQEVSAEWNPEYHSLLKEFQRLTGIGGVLNTSFNLHGYPIVSRPEDALEVFDRSRLTHLAIGNWLVTKR